MIQKSILVIDDEADIRDNISRILSHAGYMVQTAESIREAVKKLVENDFDLITCDVMIPAIGGFELVEQIRSDKKYAHIPILMITGMEEEILANTTHEADAVLQKPFSSDALLNKVKSMVFA